MALPIDNPTTFGLLRYIGQEPAGPYELGAEAVDVMFMYHLILHEATIRTVRTANGASLWTVTRGKPWADRNRPGNTEVVNPGEDDGKSHNLKYH